jgi:putative tryptophan/tyrosine transport system substrate-binding protein
MARLSRRQFVVGVGASSSALLAGCGRLPWPGQQAAKVPRVGFLAVGSREGRAPLIAAFLQGLRDLGYAEGQNFTIEYRFSDAADDRLPALAADLVARRVDAILASGTLAALAAKQSTSTIPIVAGASADLVGTGLVQSLARPGGNVTGLSIMAPVTAGKRLQLLQETVPGLVQVAVVLNETSPAHVLQEREVETAAPVLGITVHSLRVHSARDLEETVRAARAAGDQAIYLTADPLFLNARVQLAELALSYGLPSVFEVRENVEAGGLLSYGPNFASLYRRAAYYVDRILKGASPADLPVEQPMRFDFVVNMITARELGITFPNEIMLQVTEVIQ